MMKKKFKIDHLDPLGQGVYREDEEIYFIKKVLPEEIGTARIIKKSRGKNKSKLNWGILENKDELIVSSPQRITSQCPHFQNCPGCHYLHTTYENELIIKSAVWERLFKILERKSIHIFNSNTPVKFSQVRAQERFFYRNRIQLHFDLGNKLLGLVDTSGGDEKNLKILPIPNCQLPQYDVKEKLSELYENENWIKLIERELNNEQEKSQKKGHIEIYSKNNIGFKKNNDKFITSNLSDNSQENIKVSINKSYAHGGFSQVHNYMNDKMREKVLELLKMRTQIKILDLFGGSGNLTWLYGEFNKKVGTIVVDFNPPLEEVLHPTQIFMQSNILHSDFIKKDMQKIKNQGPFSTLIVNPPRSGFQDLSQVLGIINPNLVIYISCNPHTLIRDLDLISSQFQHQNSLKLIEVVQFDMFPGSYHFETLVVLEKVNKV
jgi:23S rRNA (uracil1939-C5)-methyltransferase